MVVLPVPYEHTSSFGKGTASGPVSILEASGQVELYDEELDTEVYTLTGGISTLEPLDLGGNDAVAVESIREQVHGLIGKDKTVVCIGGEHTISIGSARAHSVAISEPFGPPVRRPLRPPGRIRREQIQPRLRHGPGL